MAHFSCKLGNVFYGEIMRIRTLASFTLSLICFSSKGFADECSSVENYKLGVPIDEPQRLCAKPAGKQGCNLPAGQLVAQISTNRTGGIIYSLHLESKTKDLLDTTSNIGKFLIEKCGNPAISIDKFWHYPKWTWMRNSVVVNAIINPVYGVLTFTVEDPLLYAQLQNAEKQSVLKAAPPPTKF
jgi:hypothetical protein